MSPVLNGRAYDGSDDEGEPVYAPDDIQESVNALNENVHDNIDDTIGFCTECHNPQPDQHMLRSPFFGSGGSVPCKFCGAPTIIVRQRLVNDHLKDRLNQMRGIGSTQSIPGVN